PVHSDDSLDIGHGFNPVPVRLGHILLQGGGAMHRDAAHGSRGFVGPAEFDNQGPQKRNQKEREADPEHRQDSAPLVAGAVFPNDAEVLHTPPMVLRSTAGSLMVGGFGRMKRPGLPRPSTTLPCPDSAGW